MVLLNLLEYFITISQIVTDYIDIILLEQYPEWFYYINNGGIGLDRLSFIIDNLFTTKSKVIRVL